MTQTTQQPAEPALNPLWSDLQTVRELFPDRHYFAAVVRRQLVFAAAITALIMPFAVIRAASVPLSYQSWVTFAHDPRNLGDEGRDVELRFRQIADRMKSLGRDGFLKKIVAEGGITAPAASVSLLDGATSRLRRVLAYWLPDQPGADKASSVDRTVDAIREGLYFSADPKLQTLTLKIEADSAENAREWARRMAERFIADELSYELVRLTALEKTYAETLSGEKARQTAALANGKAEAVDPLKISRLQEREAELSLLLEQRRMASSEATSTYTRRRNELAAELSRLRTTLSSNHPDVIAKEDELRAFERGGGGPGRANLKLLMDELVDVRAKLRLAGAPSRDDPAAGFVSTMEARLGLLRLDKAHLERQQQQADERTFLRIVEGPTLSPAPVTSRAKTIAFPAAAVLALVFGLSVLREASSDRARDAWRIAAALRLPALGVMPRGLIGRAPALTPEATDRLRRSLAEPRSQGKRAVRYFSEIREIIAEIRARSPRERRRLLVLTFGDNDRTVPFLFDLFSAYATETGESLLVVDGDHAQPLAADGPSAHQSGDLCSLLEGKTTWQQSRLARTPDRPFDLLPPPADAEGPERLRAFRAAPIRRLFDAVDKVYRCVIVRGLKPQYLLENGALAEAATDVVLVVDARAARKTELVRAVDLVGRERLRGFVLIEG